MTEAHLKYVTTIASSNCGNENFRASKFVSVNEAHFAVLSENLCSRIFLKNFNYAEAFHGSWVTQYFSVDFTRWLFSIELKIPSDLISTVGWGQREKS